MRTELSFAPISEIATELLAVLAVDTQTEKGLDAKPQPTLLTADTAVQAAAADVLATGEYKAGANETVLLHAPAGLTAKRLLIVGLGKLGKATVHSVRDAAGTAVRFAKPRGIREVALALPQNDPENLLPAEAARAAVEGAFVGDFDADTYRSDRKDQSILTITLAVPAEADQAAVEAAVREGAILGESQNFTRALVNEPGNKLTPTILGQRAALMAQEVGLGWEVHSTEKLRELKMGAFLSVAQGSAGATGANRAAVRAGGRDGRASPWPGRQRDHVRYGGISIKPSDNMEKMKYDMAGGAAMIGAMRAIALLKPKVRVIAVVCAAENMPEARRRSRATCRPRCRARRSRSSIPMPRGGWCWPTG